MSLRGLPDFHQPMRTAGGVQVFYPFEGGSFVVAPDGLDIATRNDGRADFTLELVRSSQRSYGVLDFSMRPSFRMEEALTFLRGRHPHASLNRTVFTGGFLRFLPAGSDVEIPRELTKPSPLGWNDLGVARFIMKISTATATMIKEALTGETLLLTAVAEMEMLGVSPRMPVRVRFDPARLLGDLGAIANNERQIAREDLVAFFRQDRAKLPLDITGDIDGPKRDDFAEAMADRVRLRFGKAVASPVEPITPYLALATPEAAGSGSFEWDLAEPVAAERTFTLDLHPLDDARKLVKEHGLDTVFHQTTVPPIPLGAYSIAVNVNLPSERPGALALGVTLRVPPRAPQRPQAVTASVQFKPRETSATALLRLAPMEKLAYTYTTFVVLQQGTSIKRLEGQPTSSETEFLSLNQGDFPVDFIPIEAEQSLLEVAAISGSCRWVDGAAQREQKFALDPARPIVMPALPKGIAGATIEITARERGGDGMLKLGPFPAASLQLGLFSFPEFGPHTTEIECAFDDQSGHFAVELLPDGRPETREEITVLSFTRDHPKKEWTWFADSPFRPGYRYRLRRNPGEPPAAWAEVPAPFEHLKINPSTGGAR